MLNLIYSFLILSAGHANETTSLTVSIENIKAIKGSIEVGIFNKESGFLKEGMAYKTYSIKVKNASEKAEINLPKGKYAIAVYHDKNVDGKCNRNFMGIPSEPYGFSNNVKPVVSAPSFKAAAFTLTSDKTIKINLIH